MDVCGTRAEGNRTYLETSRKRNGKHAEGLNSQHPPNSKPKLVHPAPSEAVAHHSCDRQTIRGTPLPSMLGGFFLGVRTSTSHHSRFSVRHRRRASTRHRQTWEFMQDTRASHFKLPSFRACFSLDIRRAIAREWVRRHLTRLESHR